MKRKSKQAKATVKFTSSKDIEICTKNEKSKNEKHLKIQIYSTLTPF